MEHPHPSRASLILHILFSGCKNLHMHVSVSLSKSYTETQHCTLPPIHAITHVSGCLMSTTNGLRRRDKCPGIKKDERLLTPAWCLPASAPTSVVPSPQSRRD